MDDAGYLVAVMAAPDLAPDYYLRNFRTVVDAVCTRYGDLLSPEEHDRLARFGGVSADGQKLYVRLLSRKGVWFRADKLDYPEIGDVDRAADELAEAGLLTIDGAIPVADLGRLLTRPEIRRLYPEIPAPSGARKADLVAEMAARPRPALPFRVYGVHDNGLWAVLNLLFFGTLRQDLTEFVLVDLEIVRYETYELTAQSRPFRSREQIEAWRQFGALRDRYREHKAAKDLPAAVAVADELPARYPWRRLERKRQRLVNHVARDLERLGRLAEALALYQQTEQSPSRERRTRVLQALGRTTAALALCEEMRADPQDEDEAEVAERIHRGVRRRLGERVPHPERPRFCRDELTLPMTEEPVERAALRHYEAEGWTGYHCENVLINGLFGLAFWDIIFAPVADAFHNRFQRAPVDMFTPDFVPQRRAMIEARLRELDEPAFWRALPATYDRKRGLANVWVQWEALPRELLVRAVETIPPRILAGLMRRLLFDLRANRRGHPDLILFDDTRYRWVEMKGPGDQLQRHQARWLQELERLGADCRLAHVRFDASA